VHYDYLIVGQGLCGTWLSYYLIKGGAKVLVIDPGSEAAASAASAGMINPITGKRLARQWLGESLFPFLQKAYASISDELGVPLIRELPIHQFFAGSEEADLFQQKADEGNEYLHPDSQLASAESFESPFGHGTIFPAWLVDVRGLLNGWKQKLQSQGVYLSEHFDWSDCRLEAELVEYRALTANAVIDCTGAAAFDNPYFRALPFALNKGEVLLADIPRLPRDAVYKFGKRSIIPWPQGGFWIGSSFDWSFTDNLPSEEFRASTQRILERWLRLPFTLGESLAAIRPATVTRDAFAGFHPLYPRLGLLDGMGSKACSQAPYLADQLAAHMLEGRPLLPRTDLQQYRKVLSR
jgi:glycine/D-amino acid oxidase-like deaminating enzyme